MNAKRLIATLSPAILVLQFAAPAESVVWSDGWEEWVEPSEWVEPQPEPLLIASGGTEYWSDLYEEWVVAELARDPVPEPATFASGYKIWNDGYEEWVSTGEKFLVMSAEQAMDGSSCNH